MGFYRRLQEPFPDKAGFRESLKGLIGVSIFVFLFLYVVRPFGVRGSADSLLLVCLGFGMVTLVFGSLFEVFNRFVLIRTDLPSWTLWKWILQAMLLLLWIAFGNYLFLAYLSGWNWEKYAFLNMVFYTMVVGFFPILFSGIITQLKAIKQNQGIASAMSSGPNLQGAQGKHMIEITLDTGGISSAQVYYIEAQQNYLAVCYKSSGELKRELIRKSMKQMEEDVGVCNLLRCHRSYFVNKDLVSEVQGNAQGLKLYLRDLEEITIPVSRTYIPKIKEALCY